MLFILYVKNVLTFNVPSAQVCLKINNKTDINKLVRLEKPNSIFITLSAKVQFY